MFRVQGLGFRVHQIGITENQMETTEIIGVILGIDRV